MHIYISDVVTNQTDDCKMKVKRNKIFHPDCCLSVFSCVHESVDFARNEIKCV